MNISILSILDASISASWLVLVVILLRLVLKKAPRAIHCALWALVAIRLLCPVTIESEFSLMPVSQTVSDYYQIQAEASDPGPAVPEIVDDPEYPQDMEVPFERPVHRMERSLFLWSVIWLSGAAAMGVYALLSYLRLRKKISASIPIADGILLCDYIGSPFILGIFHPSIYLPSDLDQLTVDHVLAHEKAHLARHDHWWKPLGFALLSLHWFNPVMWLAYILLCRDIELACDEKVIRDLGTDQKKAYSAALLRCSVGRNLIAACPLAFGEVGVKERVKNVLNYKKPAFWVIVLALVLCGVAAVCFLTDPPRPESDTAQTDPLEDGSYIAQDKVYWAPHSSLYAYKMEMELTNNDLLIRFNDGEWSEVLSLDHGWQTECPISEDRRELVAELSHLNPEFVMQDLTGCRFLVVNDTHFIVEKDEKMYLVCWNHSSIPLEIITYIFHFVPHTEYEDPTQPIYLGSVTLDTDPADDTIYRYFMEMNSHETSENTHTSVSFRNYGTAWQNADYPLSITKNLNLRIAHYTQNGDGTITENDAQMFPVIVSLNENEDGSYEILDCVRDDADHSASALVLETECWRQAYAHFEPDMQALISAVYADHPEYFSKDTTHGLDLVWWNTDDGVRCVILGGLQRARTSSDARIHTPLTVQEAIAVLHYYDIPLQAMLSISTSTLSIYYIDPP